ncbi:hypothetical protein BaRGS_00032429 [Batillaria attramentaria]|uniref:G-protein coupled receptors family 1 profile domain-containing protein n=1 Tax=Batillaria attramentaria TaxID=370345 RepID=A0ABD0JNL3_9CAEN|nr:hypothetical protein BaRGS_014117 [Batillaria attramentaria]
MDNVSELEAISSRIKSLSLESQLALYLSVSLMAIVIVVGCAGNLMVILAVRTTKKLQIVSNAFVVNLSVCDLLFVTIVLPFNIYTYLSDGWTLPVLLCKFVGFLGYTLTGTTIITITLIAWNRYKLVVSPQGYKQLFSPIRIAVMLLAAWVLPMICLFPALLEVWGRFGYVSMMVTCNLLLDHDSQSFKLFLLIVRAAIPCGLIIYYYVRIYRTTIASHRRVKQGRLLASPTNRLDQQIQRKEMHLTKMMATIFIVFALSYFPCTISSIVDWNTVLSKRFHMFCLITVYVGSAVNPLIYGLMNSQFRHAYYTILLCRCCSPNADVNSKSAATSSSVYRKNVMIKSVAKDQEDRRGILTSDQSATPMSSPEQVAKISKMLHRTETEKTYVSYYEDNAGSDDPDPFNAI